jgi:hypothetical protein
VNIITFPKVSKFQSYFGKNHDILSWMFDGVQLSSESGAMPHSKQIHARIAAVSVALEDEFE